MMPTLAFEQHARSKGGYSLLEIMIVLAIMSVAVSILAPRAGAALDQVVIHTIQFDLQRQVSDQRRRAFVNQTPLELHIVATGDPSIGPGQSGVTKIALVQIPKGWKASLESRVALGANGQCTATRLHLSSLGKRPIHMAVTENCKLIRYFGP